MFPKLVLGAWEDGIAPSGMKNEFRSPVLRLGMLECSRNPIPRVAKVGGSPELTDQPV